MGAQEGMEFSRVIGRRKSSGVSPGTISKEQMDWMDSMNSYKICIPRGIFRYKSHEEANVDMEKWLAKTMATSNKEK